MAARQSLIPSWLLDEAPIQSWGFQTHKHSPAFRNQISLEETPRSRALISWKTRSKRELERKISKLSINVQRIAQNVKNSCVFVGQRFGCWPSGTVTISTFCKLLFLLSNSLSSHLTVKNFMIYFTFSMKNYFIQSSPFRLYFCQQKTKLSIISGFL